MGIPPSEFTSLPAPETPTSWATKSGETSTRRRYYSWKRTVTVRTSHDGAIGDTLHCQMTAGKCLHGDCDADLVAQGFYPRVHRRRRRQKSTWPALAWSRSITLQEAVDVELTQAGPTACTAMPVGNHAEVTVKAALVPVASNSPAPVVDPLPPS